MALLSCAHTPLFFFFSPHSFASICTSLTYDWKRNSFRKRNQKEKLDRAIESPPPQQGCMKQKKCPFIQTPAVLWNLQQTRSHYSSTECDFSVSLFLSALLWKCSNFSCRRHTFTLSLWLCLHWCSYCVFISCKQEEELCFHFQTCSNGFCAFELIGTFWFDCN